MSTLFSKIINREIPAEIVYEDERTIAFLDIEPVAPTHIVIATKSEIPGVASVPEAGDHQFLLNTARIVADQLSLQSYRLVVNNGPDAGQSVDHLHMHLLGGRTFSWPPG